MNKEIMLRLLVQDMKYQRFINIVYKDHGAPAEYEINLLEIIAFMMGFSSGNISDHWIETYVNYIELSFVTTDPNELEFIAEKACLELLSISPNHLYE